MSTITLTPTELDPRGTTPAGRTAGRTVGRTVVRPDGEVRLTRRGRAVVFLACLVLAFAVAFALGASSVATEEPGADSATEVVTVGTGETLWHLAAERTEAGDDVRDTMRDIERLNALESTALSAGQRLLVPQQ